MEKNYNVIEVIGEGGYGTVYKCRTKKTNEIVAIKKYKEKDCIELRKVLKREIEILKKLKHENIIELKEVFLKDSYYYLVFEYANKNLLELIENSKNGLSPETIQNFTYQMCKAVSYLHKNKIIHRDIKPENFLITENNILKLCDFDFARYFNENENEPMTEYVATRYYRAPEILLNCGHYNYAIDFWGIGCIMGEMADGEPVFPGDGLFDQLEVMIKLLGNLPEKLIEMYNKNNKFNIHELLKINEPETLDVKFANYLDESAICFLKKLLEFDPDKRLNADNVFKENYLKGLYNKENETKIKSSNEITIVDGHLRTLLNKSNDSSDIIESSESSQSSSYGSSINITDEENNNENKNKNNEEDSFFKKLNEASEEKLKKNVINKANTTTKLHSLQRKQFRSDLVDFSKNYFTNIANNKKQEEEKKEKQENTLTNSSQIFTNSSQVFTNSSQILNSARSIKESSKSTNLKINNFLSLSNKTVNSTLNSNTHHSNNNVKSSLFKKVKNTPEQKINNKAPVKLMSKFKLSSCTYLNDNNRYDLNSSKKKSKCQKNIETDNKNNNEECAKKKNVEIKKKFLKSKSLKKEAPVININFDPVNNIRRCYTKRASCFLPTINNPRRLMTNDTQRLKNKKIFLSYGINAI